ERQPAGNLELFAPWGKGKCLATGEQPAGMIEAIDAVVESPSDVKLLAVGRPDEPREGLRQGDPVDDPPSLAADRHDLVFTVTGVQDGQYRFARMHGDLDREVAQP